jgi:uncharacterized protein YndB with AHSA1/START domain
MSNAVQRGLLVIADIGGYTRYLSGVELEHSHDILADLLAAVAGRLEDGLEIVKLEGDAVFCCGEGDSLLEQLQDCYVTFALRQKTIALNTSCECDACRRIPELDLKFVAHHGSFVEHEVAGRQELVGPDVIVIHRMLKNTVPDDTGLSAYALLSKACVENLALDTTNLRGHTELYPDIGQLDGFVVDLHERWRSAAPVKLQDSDAQLVLQTDLRAAPERVWMALTDPAQQLRWRVGATSVESDREPGLGAKTHCVHGRTAVDQEIVDWHPDHYYSYTERNPIGRCLWTVELTPRSAGGSHLVWRVALSGGRAQRVMYRFAGSRMRRVVQANLDALTEFVDAPGGAARDQTADGA